MTASSGMLGLMLSIAMLGAFALAAGGFYLLFKRREKQRGLLMLGVATVLILNVLIWSLPAPH